MSQKPNSGDDWDALTPVSKVDVLGFRVQRVEQDMSALSSTVDDLGRAQAATTARLDGLATREQMQEIVGEVRGIPAVVASMIRTPAPPPTASATGTESENRETREDAAKWRVVKPFLLPILVSLLAGGSGTALVMRFLAGHEATAAAPEGK